MPRDSNDFTAPTRDKLAKRAAQQCSNRRCGKPITGPHSDETGVVDLGEACHIRGARPGSARYDSTMTPEERSHIVSAIWLCRSCGKLIDSDRARFTVDVVYRWKRQHEAAVSDRIAAPDGGVERLAELESAFRQESSAADRPRRARLLATTPVERAPAQPVESDSNGIRGPYRGRCLHAHRTR